MLATVIPIVGILCICAGCLFFLFFYEDTNGEASGNGKGDTSDTSYIEQLRRQVRDKAKSIRSGGTVTVQDESTHSPFVDTEAPQTPESDVAAEQ